MQLSSGAFNAFLGGVGQDFQWRRASACPCINPASGAATPNCPFCSGKGVTWAAEVAGKAGMQQQSPRKQFAMFGVFEPGDATLTIPSNSVLYGAGHLDRFRALNSTNPFSTAMIRGDNDKILGTVQSISRVYWIAADVIVEGGIPAVGDDGTLTWTSGEPPAGTAYSISGIKYDEFFVYLSLPSDRNAHAGAALPRKLLARKFDLFNR